MSVDFCVASGNNGFPLEGNTHFMSRATGLENVVERLSVDGTHQGVGFAIGRNFGDKIHSFFDRYEFLQERLLPFHRSSAGRSVYQNFLELHRVRFPGYISELEGMANGADRPFEEFLLVNLRGEYRGLLDIQSHGQEGKDGDVQGCTDCLVLTSDAALIGHNEDGSPAALGTMFVVHAQIDARPAFTALCYPGFLPGNAFGFNASGVVHTVDAVSPRDVRMGLGRHFLARSLLDADSLNDAIRRVTATRRAAGFTYNIGSVSGRRVICVEVSPDRHSVSEVRGHLVHTNHYLDLQGLRQQIGSSSQKRLLRAQYLCRAEPPRSSDHVLSLLGDEETCDYPIYRMATPPDSSATLCTALFDLDARLLRIYPNHPVRAAERSIGLAL
jgi:hypothetical protein